MCIRDRAGGFLIAKKPGTAKVSALVNGKRRTITVIVGKKPAPCLLYTSFTVTSPSADNHGPVRVAGTYYLAYEDGTPYHCIGTTCYVLSLIHI